MGSLSLIKAVNFLKCVGGEEMVFNIFVPILMLVGLIGIIFLLYMLLK